MRYSSLWPLGGAVEGSGRGMRMAARLFAAAALVAGLLVAVFPATAQDAAVGSVLELEGAADAVRTDGSRASLQPGSEVFLGDRVETGTGSTLAIRFVDGTLLSIAANASMTIDELVYDPGAQDNASLFSLTQGLFVLVSGDIAKSGDMVVTTPVSTIGIRGTAVAIQAAREELENIITLLDDPAGTGIVTVANDVIEVALTALGDTAVLVTSTDPITTASLTAQDIANVYAAALAVMQRITGSNLGAAPASEVSAEDAAEVLLLLQQLIEAAQENPAQDASPE